MSLFSTARLHIYTVHLRTETKRGGERIRFVAEGFNWMTFLFNVLWMLMNRLWLMTALFLAANTVLALIIEQLGMDEISMMILQIGLQVWFGYHANDFLRSKLRRDGYITYALVSGENTMRAEQRFFDRHSEMLAGV